MEHLLQHPSQVSDLMPRQLLWRQNYYGWEFSSEIPNDELEYQRTVSSIMSAAHVIIGSKGKLSNQSFYSSMSSSTVFLLQFWASIKVDGSTFLSIADQPFFMNKKLDERLCSYRRLCLNTLIPIDKYNEEQLGHPGRVFRTRLPEYNPAIQWGILSYYATPMFESIYDQQCIGVFEVVSTEPFDRLPRYIEFRDRAGLDHIKMGLDEILKIHSLPYAQIWIPSSESVSLNVLFPAGAASYDHSNLMYIKFEYASQVCFMESGKALVGRAFASQGSCFCKDFTLLSLQDYPLVPIARKVRLTQSFAICLRSKCDNNMVYVIEYFLPPYEMDVRGTETFLNVLLSTMKEQLPGFIVASGQQLGQRMLVEVVKVSPSDELDSFEIGQSLPSVQSLQDRGETTDIDSFWQQANLQNVEAAANRGTANVDVAHDDQIEFVKDTGENMQLDSYFEQPSVEIGSMGNAGGNDKLEHFNSGAVTSIQKTNSHKNNKILRIIKDHDITREIVEQQFGKTLKDAAKALSVSPSTLKRICREYEISRWPHHKTRKAYHNFSQGTSLQAAEPHAGDQLCPNFSQEKETNSNEHKGSHSKGKPCKHSVMSVKVTYRDDIIKFKLTPSATMVQLEGEVGTRLNISLQRFSIKYQDEDDDWVTITGDSDLREGMREIRLLGRTTMKLVVTPKTDT